MIEPNSVESHYGSLQRSKSYDAKLNVDLDRSVYYDKPESKDDIYEHKDSNHTQIIVTSFAPEPKLKSFSSYGNSRPTSQYGSKNPNGFYESPKTDSKENNQ